MASILADLEARTGETLPAGFESAYRQRVSELFVAHLRPMLGVVEMLKAIPLPMCVASSGPRAKIEQALSLSGLSRFFGERTFSAYEVGSWKPDPGLFLHAATAMGVPPDRCAVVEDSAVGIAAAAGMAAFYYQRLAGQPGSLGGIPFSDIACRACLGSPASSGRVGRLDR